MNLLISLVFFATIISNINKVGDQLESYTTTQEVQSNE